MWNAIVIIASLALLLFIGEIFGFLKMSFFQPKTEALRYQTFKESQAYNEGMLRDLQNIKLQYVAANPDQQAALRAIVLQRFSVYPIDRLPADLQSFYFSINQGLAQ
jgi:hypothetical protein